VAGAHTSTHASTHAGVHDRNFGKNHGRNPAVNDALESLLKRPGLWRAGGGTDDGITPGIPTGYPRLDRQLPGGGWPRHALTEILLEQYGAGELKLVMPALARLSRMNDGLENDADREGSGERWLAWIAPPFQPYPPALLQWDIDLARMLIVRPRPGSETLWAAEQALASGTCAAVLLWPRPGDRIIDHTASRRLQLAAARGHCQAFLFRTFRSLLQPSAAALRLKIEAGMHGTDVGILKSRGGRPAIVRNYGQYAE
jgi:hypothetical protein